MRFQTHTNEGKGCEDTLHVEKKIQILKEKIDPIDVLLRNEWDRVKREELALRRLWKMKRFADLADLDLLTADLPF